MGEKKKVDIEFKSHFGNYSHDGLYVHVDQSITKLSGGKKDLLTSINGQPL